MKRILIILIASSSLFSQGSMFKQFSNSFADIAENVNESVVTITTTNKVTMDEDVQNFYRYWGRSLPEEFESKSLGSGVIVDEDNAYIVTNHHVIFDERNDKPVDQIMVELMDKRVFEATVVGLDRGTDLAVLQIEADNIKAVPIGDSELVRVGEWVLAIGSPFSANLSHTVTAGIISAMGRNNVMRGSDTYQNFIQTDAAINPGNSGGALLNMSGELIGINAAIASGSGRSNAGIGFAIPSSIVTKVMNDLISKGYVVRSFLGIYMQDINEDLYETMGLESRKGTIVSDIVEGSPAEKSGLESGDVIVAFEGKEITNGAALKNLVSSASPGQKITLTISREGKVQDINVVLEERSGAEMASSSSNDFDKFGLSVLDLTDDLIDQYDIQRPMNSDIQGVVVVNIEEGGIAEQSGMLEGDLITRIGRQKISNLTMFKEEISKYEEDKKILFLVKRGNASRFLTLRR
ncbi:Do family serine endopeptidase [Candidatus Marinimicrobia bacterium]|jgi:serine protease Do|nr:Do family serine endopeptidase [Candidatus Neomarinimicrobiota bacterium]MDB3887624.1 Do family serine endopeptidase [Candidatus Neomarinimicrobiota bacterium]MDC0878009.1 Do family serine endopeptidase [Candidatus Neomarinimicrobiota bacterium]MDC1145324.1 Do family serine endopeptidase [Candidatus Neomarinimicrobiota bacterium]MDC3287744.1 Do family serine endopeptidase [Candidatus Neomarinimicrobiota bacterium]|tara:strand:+ start:5058 stop:6452 length:1395 start_codon:yes stop_codon:yes gene_type:complete